MSREAYKRVWEQRDRRGTRKLALLALADHADPLGVCWPNAETVGEFIGETKNWALRLLSQAENDGDVIRNPGKGRGHATVYGLAVGLSADERHRLAIVVAHTVVRKGVRYNVIDGTLTPYTPGSEDQIIGQGILEPPTVEREEQGPAPAAAASPPQPQPTSTPRPARRPPAEPEHIRWLRVEEGIVPA